MSRRSQIGFGAVVTVLTVLLSACGGGSGGSRGKPAASHSSPPPDIAAPYRRDVAAFDNSSYASMVQSYTMMGLADCAVGKGADFPSETLITVISSEGSWAQFAVVKGQMEMGSFRNGEDYQSALPAGEDWQSFKADSGVNCHVTHSGRIRIS